MTASDTLLLATNDGKVVICVLADIRWQGWKAKVPAPLGHIPIALLKFQVTHRIASHLRWRKGIASSERYHTHSFILKFGSAIMDHQVDTVLLVAYSLALPL